MKVYPQNKRFYQKFREIKHFSNSVYVECKLITRIFSSKRELLHFIYFMTIDKIL